MARFPLERGKLDAPFSNGQFFRFLWRYIRPYRGRFILATIARFVAEIIWLYPAYAIAKVVTLFSEQRTPDLGQQLIFIAWTFGIAVLIRTVSLYVAHSVGFRIAESAAQDAYQDAFQHLLRLDMQWQERENAGNKLKRMDRGSMSINRMVRFWLRIIIEVSVSLIGMISIISHVTLGLGIALGIFVIVFLLISSLLTNYVTEPETIMNRKEEELQGFAFEAINNIRTVKALDMTPSLVKRIDDQKNKLVEVIKLRISRFQNRTTALNTWAQAFRYASLIYIVFAIYHGQYTIGFLVLFQSYYGSLWNAVSQLSELAPDIISAKYAAARIEHILQEPIQIEGLAGKQQFPKKWQHLTLKNLTFSYDEKPVLQNISLTIQRGEKIGIVGLSGAGKSTLFKLLMKEHEGYMGDIHFDEVPLRNIEKSSYLQSMAAVLQETEVFNFSLEENISIARAGKNRERLAKALQVSHVIDFIDKLPSGLKTLIGEKGFRLSGGEKQRVGLARAIYKQPQLLLLDEATSHLDLESEKKIQESLHEFFQTVTAIVIAHRLTTIKEMDRIVVIEDGKIVESGSFSTLFKSKGRFFELWEQQKL